MDRIALFVADDRIALAEATANKLLPTNFVCAPRSPGKPELIRVDPIKSALLLYMLM